MQTLSNFNRSKRTAALSYGDEGNRECVPVLGPGYASSRNSSQTADSYTTLPLCSRTGTVPRGLRSSNQSGLLFRCTNTVSCLQTNDRLLQLSLWTVMYSTFTLLPKWSIRMHTAYIWFHGSAVEHWSLTGEHSLSCARPTADGQPSRPTQPFNLSGSINE